MRSQHLGQKITKFLWYRHVSSTVEDFADTQGDIMSQLSPALRNEVLSELQVDALGAGAPARTWPAPPHPPAFAFLQNSCY